jgi:hypothetical protein
MADNDTATERCIDLRPLPVLASDITDQSREIISAVNQRPLAYDESKFLDHLIEQYKLYVGMTDQLSSRRILVNNGFTALMGASAVAYSAAPSYLKDSGFDAPFQIGIALASIIFAILWHQTMIHYKELSTAKFTVIQEIEELLPARPYTAEYLYFTRDRLAKTKGPFRTLAEMEALIPLIATIVSVSGLLLGIYRLFH